MRITQLQRSLHGQNRLLAGLSKRDCQQLLAHATLIDLKANAILVDEGRALRHVYFPVDCYIGVFSPGKAAAAMAVAVIGAEGMLGDVVLLGAVSLPGPAVVIGAGTAWRISRNAFASIIAESDAIKRRLLLYVHHAIINLAQHAVCGHFHSIESRLARWLLMVHDRVDSDHFALTQQMLADLLGVRRVGITLAAIALQQRNLIDYRRGIIRLIDRKGLVATACSCYGVSEAHFRKTLG